MISLLVEGQKYIKDFLTLAGTRGQRWAARGATAGTLEHCQSFAETNGNAVKDGSSNVNVLTASLIQALTTMCALQMKAHSGDDEVTSPDKGKHTDIQRGRRLRTQGENRLFFVSSCQPDAISQPSRGCEACTRWFTCQCVAAPDGPSTGGYIRKRTSNNTTGG